MMPSRHLSLRKFAASVATGVTWVTKELGTLVTKEVETLVVGDPDKSDKNRGKMNFTVRHNRCPMDFSCSSMDRTVTRSQTGFCRVEKSPSNLALFSDKTRFKIPAHRHLMLVMKGDYGNIPSTVITRSTGEHYDITEDIRQELKIFKNFRPHIPVTKLSKLRTGIRSNGKGSSYKKSSYSGKPRMRPV